MAKFILLYKGPATPAEQMTPEQSQAAMGNWKTWMDKVGTHLVDMGQPMDGNGRSVVDDGSSGSAEQLNGYSIIEADNMDAAVELVDGHPFLSDKTGKFSVDVYELQAVPEM